MKTINLRNYRTQPHTPALIFLGVIALLFIVNGLAPRPQPTVATPTPALIYVLSTREPTVQPTADAALLREVEALKARVAELEAQRSKVVPDHFDSAQGAEPQSVYQQMSVQKQAPTPYTADPQIEYSAAGSTVQIEVPTDAPRLCDGFGDWRDYDARFEASPACHKAAP